MKIVTAYNMALAEEPLAMMREIADVVTPRDGSEEALIEAVRDADSLLVDVHPPVPRRVIEAAPRLKHVARMGIGVDTVDIKAATEHGIMVTNAPEASSDTVAEFTMTLLLCVARNVTWCDRAVRTGHWHDRLELININRDLFGKTHGIIGLGRIGGRVAIRCKAFGMKVVYFKRNRDLAFEKEHGVEYWPLDRLIRESDSISLHTPLTDETRNSFGRPQFEAMKRTAFLVNQSRGKVVNEKDLVEALREGLIAGYASDVFDNEPPDPASELLTFQNVFLSPHLAGLTRDSRYRLGMTVATDAIEVLRGGVPKNLVNKDVLGRLRRTPAEADVIVRQEIEDERRAAREAGLQSR
jgi:phosphoglycerate dehydrogenase-like enzyme